MESNQLTNTVNQIVILTTSTVFWRRALLKSTAAGTRCAQGHTNDTTAQNPTSHIKKGKTRTLDIIDCDLSDCANYSGNATLLINWHITGGLNLHCAVN